MPGIYADVLHKDSLLCPHEWRLRPLLDFTTRIRSIFLSHTLAAAFDMKLIRS
jgi:hypothetical protein